MHRLGYFIDMERVLLDQESMESALPSVDANRASMPAANDVYADEPKAGKAGPKKVLMSAFACCPDKGSETAVGWNWAIEAAQRGHEVTVLTRHLHAPEIERYGVTVPTLHFSYVDAWPWLAIPARKLLGGYWGHYAQYYLWQVAAALKARQLHRIRPFDLVHHVTYVTLRFPTFMGFVGPYFILGPGSGGESIPGSLRRHLPYRLRWFEGFRDLANAFVKLDPLAGLCLRSADRILVTSEDSLRLLPQSCRARSRQLFAIGCNLSAVPALRRPPARPLRILFSGRVSWLKGIDLALNAVAQARKSGLSCVFTIIGNGPDEGRMRQLAAELGLDGVMEWRPRVPQQEFIRILPEFDVFFCPTLRESGGMAILEARECRGSNPHQRPGGGWPASRLAAHPDPGDAAGAAPEYRGGADETLRADASGRHPEPGGAGCRRRADFRRTPECRDHSAQ